MLPTLRSRFKWPQVTCLHNNPECGGLCDPFPDKNLSMFYVWAVWVQVQGKAQNEKAHWVPATIAKKLGLFLQKPQPCNSHPTASNCPSTTREKHILDQWEEDNFHMCSLSGQLSLFATHLLSTSWLTETF